MKSSPMLTQGTLVIESRNIGPLYFAVADGVRLLELAVQNLPNGITVIKQRDPGQKFWRYFLATKFADEHHYDEVIREHNGKRLEELLNGRY